MTSSSTKQNRGWLEGTLDVISTMTPPPRQSSTPSTPRNNDLSASFGRNEPNTAGDDDFTDNLNQLTSSFQKQKTLMDRQLQEKIAQVESLQRSKLTLEQRLQNQESRCQMLENDLKPNNTVESLQQQLQEKTLENRRLQEELAQICRGNSPVKSLADDFSHDESSTVQKLREQCLDYSRQLTELTTQLSKIRAEADRREGYRRDEADDLRILTDAQDEQMEQLKRELQQVKTKESHTVLKLKQQLAEAVAAKDKSQLELETIRGETALCVADLHGKMEEMQAESQAQSNTSSQELKQALVTAENEKERLHQDYRRQLAQLRETHQAQRAEWKARLDSTQAGERPEEKVPQQKQQSGGALEEDLRKELRSVKSVRDKLQSELSVMRRNKDAEITELRNKLEDRDTTISALVKSSVSLEEQVAAAQIEIENLIMQQRGNVVDQGVDLVISKGDAEMTDLKRRLDESRRTEENFSSQVYRLRKQLQTARAENSRLQEKLDAAGSGLDDSQNQLNKQLKERDDAISNLVKQSIAQDRLIGELREKLAATNQEMDALNGNRENTPSFEEVKQLREEAEVFAGQVIELDEEIDSLRTTVTMKEQRISELEAKLAEAQQSRSEPSDEVAKQIMDLEAEIDELREANSTQQDELRTLRRKERQQESYRDHIAAAQRELHEAKQEAKRLTELTEKATAEKDKLSTQLQKEKGLHESAVRKLEDQILAARQDHKRSIETLENELAQKKEASARVPDPMVDEFEVQTMRDEIDNLRKNLSMQSSSLDTATATIRELESMLAEKNSSEAAAQEEEKEEFLREIETLTKQLEEAQDQMQKQEEERGIIDDFKEKLELADEAREVSEKTIVENYERKLSLLTLDKDVTIDKLRNELVEEKEGNIKKIAEASAKIKHFESETQELREEMTAQLDQRETRIFALEHTLEAQEQLVKNMRIEMDHLQGSMETAASSRRGEVDELQQELAELTSKTQKQDREMKALEMKLEQEKLSHESEVKKLQETITALEGQTSSEKRDADDLKMELRLQAVKDRLEKLSWRNNSLKDENVALRDRLVKAEAQIQMSDQDKDEVVQLKQTIVVQEQALEDLQAELEMIKAPPSTIPMAKSSNSPQKPSSEKKAKASPPRRLGGFLGRKR